MLDTLGAVVGPLTAVVLLQWLNHNYGTLFALTLIPGLIAAALMAFVVKERTRVPVPHPGIGECLRALPKRFRGFLVAVGLFGVGDFAHALLTSRKRLVNEGLNANPILKAIHSNVESKKGFKVMLTNWVVQETGGPKLYQPDPFGKGKSMKDSHQHLNISNREFDIIRTLALATFYHYNIGNHEIDQLMDDLESYRGVIVTRKDEAPFKSRLVK